MILYNGYQCMAVKIIAPLIMDFSVDILPVMKTFKGRLGGRYSKHIFSGLVISVSPLWYLWKISSNLIT